MTQHELAEIPYGVYEDVQEYLVENQLPVLFEELTPREVFEYWLHWNGIIGWTTRIISTLEALGWKRV